MHRTPAAVLDAPNGRPRNSRICRDLLLLKSLTDRLDYRYRDGHHCLDFEKPYPS